MLNRINSLLVMFGLNLRTTGRALAGLPIYFRNRKAFKRQLESGNSKWSFGRAYPCLFDRYDESGSADQVYFVQDLHVAQRVFRAVPNRHVDVGSRIDGFVANVATFRELT